MFQVTVSLGSSGWGWLVAGRRLIVWRYKTGSARSQCRELSLPPSDLSHKADLCLVYAGPSSGQTPCCLAVSPEGAVRYWPSIAQEGSSTEISAELHGQECCSLTEVQGVGCLLATTTATLLLIHHTGQSIACRRLALPTGLLGGIGRRVSSLLWGAQGGGGGEGRLVRVTASEEGGQGELYVLTSAGLQKWQLRDDGEEVLHYESDVGALLREAVWASQPRVEGTAAWLKLWLMDLSVEEDRAVLLVAGIDQHSSSPVLQYGVASLVTRGAEPPVSLASYTSVPGLACMLGEGEEPRQHKLVAISDWAFVFNREGVVIVEMNRQQGEQERVASHILGAGRTNELPLFFSSQHGVVSLAPVSAPSPTLEQSTLEAADLSSLQVKYMLYHGALVHMLF